MFKLEVKIAPVYVRFVFHKKLNSINETYICTSNSNRRYGIIGNIERIVKKQIPFSAALDVAPRRQGGSV